MDQRREFSPWNPKNQMMNMTLFIALSDEGENLCFEDGQIDERRQASHSCELVALAWGDFGILSLGLLL